MVLRQPSCTLAPRRDRQDPPRTLDEYLALFATRRRPSSARARHRRCTCGRRRRGCAHRRRCSRDARIIAILREPASFLRSLHLQFVQSHVETESDFARRSRSRATGAKAERSPRDTYWPQALLYSEHVRYVEQLRRYRAVFAPEQMLVLIYDDFRDDNEGTVREVLRFLEVDDDVPIDGARGEPDGAGPLAAAARPPARAVRRARPRFTAPLKRTIKAAHPAATARTSVAADQAPLSSTASRIRPTRR